MKAISEAPAKVIVTGEHFVVHGAWALSAAVGLRTRVTVSAATALQMESGRYHGSKSGALLPARRVVESMAHEFSFRPNLAVSIESNIPGGAGLGSSASAMVGVGAAVSRYESLDLDEAEIAKWAMHGERMVHGTPSGVDAVTCALGGVLLFRPGSPPRNVELGGERRLLIAYSGKARSTRRLVSHVGSVKQRLPHLMEGFANSASQLSEDAARRLASGDSVGLGRLMTLNHALLSAVGVSNPSLDSLVDLLMSMGCNGAKLTGAGGGGCVAAVLPEGKEKSTVSELKRRGFEAFVAVVPIGGVRSWLDQS